MTILFGILNWYIVLVLMFMDCATYVLGDSLPEILIPIYIMLYLNTLMFLWSRERASNTQLAIIVGITAINVLFLIWKYGLWMYWGYIEANATFGRSYMASEGWIEVVLMGTIYLTIFCIIFAYKFTSPISTLLKVFSWLCFPLVVAIFDLVGIFETTVATWFFIGILLVTKTVTEIDNKYKGAKWVVFLRDYYTIVCIFGLFIAAMLLQLS